MERSIENSIRYLTDMRKTYQADTEMVSIAIDTMRKYQKIEELVTKWSTWNADNHYVLKIREILEND